MLSDGQCNMENPSRIFFAITREAKENAAPMERRRDNLARSGTRAQEPQWRTGPQSM